MAGVSNVNISGADALGNPKSNNLMPIAPPITAGASPTLADLTNASLETDGRECQQIANKASVTDAEAPAWALPLLALPPLVTAIDARQRNELAQRRNFRNAGPGIASQFEQLAKVNPGVGPPTSGQAVSKVAAANVGTVYPAALAPRSRLDVLGMTQVQISALAEWVNDQFGIVAADGIAARRMKLLDHYMYE